MFTTQEKRRVKDKKRTVGKEFKKQIICRMIATQIIRVILPIWDEDIP